MFFDLQPHPFQERIFEALALERTHRRLWDQVGPAFYDYIVVDEAHHGTAASYRPLFDHFDPRILLGLTATPERMDGGNVAADFHNRFAAEIRPGAPSSSTRCHANMS